MRKLTRSWVCQWWVGGKENPCTKYQESGISITILMAASIRNDVALVHIVWHTCASPTIVFVIVCRDMKCILSYRRVGLIHIKSWRGPCLPKYFEWLVFWCREACHQTGVDHYGLLLGGHSFCCFLAPLAIPTNSEPLRKVQISRSKLEK